MENPQSLSGLEAAYSNCRYLVMAPAGEIDLRAGRRNIALDALLDARGARFAALLTAANPRSRIVHARQNAARHRVLVFLLRRRGLAGLPTCAVDPEGHWPDEPGVLVPGLHRGQALALARHFNQHALLWCEQGRAPQVLWTASGSTARAPFQQQGQAHGCKA